jgi:glycosyltransferase involved in cell wall biosynthesis
MRFPAFEVWLRFCRIKLSNSRSMRIAEVAPLYESVPPKYYGGTERIISFLTEELIRQGHEVTLFASADSITKANLIPIVPGALRLDPDCLDQLAPHIVEIQEVAEHLDEFDIVHFHIDYLHFPFSQVMSRPHVTTLHGRLDIPELQLVYHKFSQPVISISNDQRKPLPQANYLATVYHGLPLDLFKQSHGSGKYLAFLGRTSPEKGLDKAIEWAVAANLPLKIAAKVDKVDQQHFDTCIKPLLEHPLIEFVGEINEQQKQDFLGDALALLFPINWAEPFGIVIIEAMACGTPVIAHGRGSVPEIIEQGKNGFIVSSTEEAVECIRQIPNLDRNKIRQAFEERFTAERMTKDYLAVFSKLISMPVINLPVTQKLTGS